MVTNAVVRADKRLSEANNEKKNEYEMDEVNGMNGGIFVITCNVIINSFLIILVILDSSNLK